LRLFTGIKLPTEIKKKIYSITQDFRKIKSIKWVEMENLHITLKFIGEVEEKKYFEIANLLEKVNFSEFEIILQNGGVFPNYHNPKVIWIGVSFKEGTLDKLFYEIEEKLEVIGVKKENRKFKPHLTLGRVKKRSGIEEVLREIRGDKFKNFRENFLVKEFTLFESILKREGPIYSEKNIYRSLR